MPGLAPPTSPISVPSSQLPLVESALVPTPLPAPCISVQLQMCSPCSPCSPCPPAHMQLSSPCRAEQMPLLCGPSSCPHGVPQPLIPLPPQLRIADQAGTTIGVQWHGLKSAASSYVVELCDAGAPNTHQFACPAPAQEVDLLELCVSGFSPGHCYTACIRSVSPCGCESSPSGWSLWLTLPTAQHPSQPCADASVLAGLRSPSSTPPVSPHSLLQPKLGLKHLDTGRVMLAPEVAGHEEEMLFLD